METENKTQTGCLGNDEERGGTESLEFVRRRGQTRRRKCETDKDEVRRTKNTGEVESG